METRAEGLVSMWKSQGSQARVGDNVFSPSYPGVLGLHVVVMKVSIYLSQKNIQSTAEFTPEVLT